MGRYTGPSCRLCRREGVKLFLKGQKCYTAKCPIEKRAYPPGQHGQLRIRLSDYGIQLREKQKAKRIYGMFETQFRRYFQRAQKSKGVTGQLLLQQLERRLDSVLYRIGFAASRKDGRQLVRHRMVAVGARVVDIPSYQVHAGDVVQIIKGSEGAPARVKLTLEQTKDRQAPAWAQVDIEQLKGTIIRLPEKEDIQLPVQEQLIVELYSR
jgi:small subunit ribosomal protein S4